MCKDRGFVRNRDGKIARVFGLDGVAVIRVDENFGDTELRVVRCVVVGRD